MPKRAFKLRSAGLPEVTEFESCVPEEEEIEGIAEFSNL